ncbi:SDR family NAD(P)-dependent oxidoreductase [Sphingomonas desiccabilis]|uniref:SDR family NAD(P)-dependent oxidoreductase n=1 Tax=Sphingomonas desiccabilis TaxID=429134 RepID=A0A4V1QP75_9SPHN|nr:SDR family NAD(P)-dependent oxidoreductase [Sphingomonas desiccabilis]MBB3910996.1 short-subunit dehydrogenase [Sphingomonas desiccabilis]RXZ32184.1 SDR family NAD(P)-dependent oxidoreductase [Sphingomonas desiccabilis]
MAEKLAVITGASTGIGYEIAKIAAGEGFDLIVVADEPQINAAAGAFGADGISVQAVQADLSTIEGNDQLLAAIGERDVDVLVANAGLGLGHAFLDQDVAAWRRVIDTNVTGTTYLLQKMLQRMKARDAGQVLITGSIAGLMPGAYQAVYNGTKAYLDSFAYALRNELKDTSVSITVLMPGPTETEFFKRANMMDTPVGTQDKDDAAMVARTGWDAMQKGTAHVVAGTKNKIQAAVSHVVPDTVLARMHENMAKPDGE